RLLFETITLEVKLAAEPLRVKADRDQLEQVILNLAANARDAMPSGGRFSIETSRGTLGEKPAVLLTFTDTGTGMDEETLARAFEPFFTTKAKGRGTGMGLASAFGTVQQHDGVITAES